MSKAWEFHKQTSRQLHPTQAGDGRTNRLSDVAGDLLTYRAPGLPLQQVEKQAFSYMQKGTFNLGQSNLLCFAFVNLGVDICLVLVYCT